MLVKLEQTWSPTCQQLWSSVAPMIHHILVVSLHRQKEELVKLCWWRWWPTIWWVPRRPDLSSSSAASHLGGWWKVYHRLHVRGMQWWKKTHTVPRAAARAHQLCGTSILSWQKCQQWPGWQCFLSKHLHFVTNKHHEWDLKWLVWVNSSKEHQPPWTNIAKLSSARYIVCFHCFCWPFCFRL